MTAVLVGDVGATGSDWILADDQGSRHFSLNGYNPVSQQQGSLDKIVDGLHLALRDQEVEIHYYGAGIGITSQTEQVKTCLAQKLKTTSISLHSDLLGAARALCGTTPGIVCILGTGSNACFYDGSSVLSGHSLGYPLGDEGSGMDIGRRIVKAFYYGLMPKHLYDHFSVVLPASRVDFLTHFRATPAPNRYLGSLIKHMQEVVNDSFIIELLDLAFTEFINCHLYNFKSYSKINIVGSIAYYFCAQFEKCLEKHQLHLGRVIQRPIEDLVSFHKKK